MGNIKDELLATIKVTDLEFLSKDEARISIELEDGTKMDGVIDVYDVAEIDDGQEVMSEQNCEVI